MFDGRTKANREKIHRRFSFDLTNRCTVEYNFAIKEAAGKLDKLVNRQSYVADCDTGHCGDTCRAYSYICKGTESDFGGKEFLPEHARCLYMTEDDEKLHRAIRMLKSNGISTETTNIMRCYSYASLLHTNWRNQIRIKLITTDTAVEHRSLDVLQDHLFASFKMGGIGANTY
ncbi:unnamed protein product [Mytilus edulis]|uniref:Uncharacterized protein n=1 Tax=Mytilus edulis TaxID=6550 RepID=A0A8S3PWK1_MYTED|nr:unnamed protein product [Mytilus edulis]